MQIKNHASNAETFKIWNAPIASGEVESIQQPLKNKELGLKDKLSDDSLSPLGQGFFKKIKRQYMKENS